MGERAGNANLGEVALTLRALYGVESNLRLDRIRDVSARVQELSGYALEPWKPVTGETLFRRESGAVASQFHDPPSIEPYSSALVAAERGIVLGKKSGLDSIRIKAEELGLDVPEERRAELLAKVKELGARKRGLVTDDEFRELARWLTTTRSSSAAASTRSRAARCSRAAGWRVCVLERNDWLGGAIHTAELTEPGFLHDVFSAWHPLWVGGAAHAQLGDELAARGLEYLNTDLPTATAFPDGERGVPAARRRGQRAASSARSGRACSSGSSRTPTSRSACSAPSSGRRRASRSARRRCAGSGAAGFAAFAGELLQTSRDWLEQTFASERAHGAARAVGAAHRASGPTPRPPGFMTQVIAVAVQEGGMPIPRGGGAKLADALVQLIRDHGGTLRDRRRRRARARAERAARPACARRAARPSAPSAP